MRRFTDADGKGWQATVGKQSYGAMVLLFMADGDGQVLQAELDVANNLEAERALDRFGEGDLQCALAGAVPWPEGLS